MSAFLWNRSVNLLDPRPRRRDFLAEANPPDEKEETENAIRLNQNLVIPIRRMHPKGRNSGTRSSVLTGFDAEFLHA